MEFAHARIQTGQFRVVISAIAIISSNAQFSCEISVSRGDHSAFTGNQELGGRKAEDFSDTKITNAPAVYVASESMRRVTDQRNRRVRGDGLDFHDGRRVSEQMDGEYGACAGGHLKFDRVRVDAKGFRIAVGENRLQTIPKEAVSGGMKGETRKYHFALQIQRLQGEDEAGGATGDCDAMRDAEIFFSGFLELANESSIGKLTAAQNLAHVAHKFFAGEPFRRHDGHALIKHGPTASYRRNIRTQYRHHSAPNCSGRFNCLPISAAGTPATSAPSTTSFNTTAPAPT